MAKEMPLYKCHKQVRALRIQSIRASTRIHLIFEDKSYEPREVGAEWVKRFEPQPGGYYVQYDDGYFSYSPQKAFEEGYSLVKYG